MNVFLRLRDLGAADALVKDDLTHCIHEGKDMAHEEPLLNNPPTHEVAHHVRDYEGFVRLLKWGAIACLIIAFLVILIIS